MGLHKNCKQINQIKRYIQLAESINLTWLQRAYTQEVQKIYMQSHVRELGCKARHVLKCRSQMPFLTTPFRPGRSETQVSRYRSSPLPPRHNWSGKCLTNNACHSVCLAVQHLTKSSIFIHFKGKNCIKTKHRVLWKPDSLHNNRRRTQTHNCCERTDNATYSLDQSFISCDNNDCVTDAIQNRSSYS